VDLSYSWLAASRVITEHLREEDEGNIRERRGERRERREAEKGKWR